MPPPAYRDRIVGHRKVPASSLKPHPMNWRTHPGTQKSALEGSLSAVGVARSVLAYVSDADRAANPGMHPTHPDAPLTLIDGHLRAETLAGAPPITVEVLDVNDEEARLILVTLDPLAAMAGEDTDILGDLMAEIGPQDDALQALIDDLAGQAGVEGADGPVRPLPVVPPPTMTWILVGIPTVRFSEINADIERMAALPGVLCEVVANSQEVQEEEADGQA